MIHTTPKPHDRRAKTVQCRQCGGEGTPYPSDPEGSQTECSMCGGSGKVSWIFQEIIEWAREERLGKKAIRVLSLYDLHELEKRLRREFAAYEDFVAKALKFCDWAHAYDARHRKLTAGLSVFDTIPAELEEAHQWRGLSGANSWKEWHESMGAILAERDQWKARAMAAEPHRTWKGES